MMDCTIILVVNEQIDWETDPVFGVLPFPKQRKCRVRDRGCNYESGIL